MCGNIHVHAQTYTQISAHRNKLHIKFKFTSSYLCPIYPYRYQLTCTPSSLPVHIFIYMKQVYSQSICINSNTAQVEMYLLFSTFTYIYILNFTFTYSRLLILCQFYLYTLQITCSHSGLPVYIPDYKFLFKIPVRTSNYLYILENIVFI